VSQYATASRTARYSRQCRNMRHCRLRRFELRCAKGPGPLGAPLDEGACERQAIQPPQRRLFSWEAQGSALPCANPNLCDFSKRRIFTFHIEVRIRYAQGRRARRSAPRRSASRSMPVTCRAPRRAAYRRARTTSVEPPASFAYDTDRSCCQPAFHPSSHGFRPHRGAHTAIRPATPT